MSENTKITQNGVTLPREGTKTRQVWDIFSALGGQLQREPSIGEVLNATREAGITDATARTQVARCRKFHGLPPLRAARTPKPEAAVQQELPQTASPAVPTAPPVAPVVVPQVPVAPPAAPVVPVLQFPGAAQAAPAVE